MAPAGPTSDLTPRPRLSSVALVVCALIVLLGPRPALASDGEHRREIRVLAASSLTEPLTEIARHWERGDSRHVELSFGGSSRLARTIVEGARADVFVSAAPKWVDHLERNRAAVPEHRTTFASNGLVWVVPSDRSDAPPNLRRAAESPPRALALGSPNVPAGDYARRALRAAGLWRALEDRVVSAENVKRALQWVALGEADAGIVYRSDARASERVATAFELPGRLQPEIRYQGVPLETSDRPALSRSFVEYLDSRRARSILRDAGFEPLSGSPESTESHRARTLDAVDEASAVRLSLVIGLVCLVGGLLPALLFGWLLARYRFVGKSLVATLLLAPLAFPPVVTGFILLRIFGQSGLAGSALASLGLHVPFTTLGAALAALVVSFPLYLLAARSAFELVDPRYEEVSKSLGVGPRRTFWRISLPLAAPGVAAGGLLAFARAIGEFGATTVLAGNVPGETQTIPLAIYTLLESPGGYTDIWTLVGISLALSFVAVLGFEWLERRQRGRTPPEGN